MVGRATAARYGAPLAFLAAVTAGVLLIRAGLDEGSKNDGTSPPPAATQTTPAKQAGARFYHIRRGDTLTVIAPRFGLTEAELIELNPGLEPTALRIGERIRVR